MITFEKMGANVHKVHLTPDTYLFFSYETLVAFKEGSIVYEDSHNYSRTTNKHKSQFIQDRHIHERIELTAEELNDKVLKFMATTAINKFDREML